MQAVESLGWLTGATRPDIAYAVSLLGHLSKDPGETHWEGVKRVIWYIAGTKGLCLCLGGERGVDLTVAFDGYVDAYFAGDTQFQSTSGYIFHLGCHECGGYRYSRLGNINTTIVFESWITIQD